MTNQEHWSRLCGQLDRLAVYSRTLGKLQFDLECCAPPEGMAQAGEEMAVLGKEVFAIMHGPDFVEPLTALHEDSDGLTAVQKSAVHHLWRDYARQKNQSPDFSYRLDLCTTQAYGLWLRAKEEKDYSLYLPQMEQLIALTRESIALRDEQKATPYDSLLDDYEEGGTSAGLDAFFAALKARILPLVKRIVTEGAPIREDFLSRPCPIPQQEAFSRWLLQQEGLRESALVLMTTEHPFTTSFGPRDVRVTTHYFEDNFISNIFSTLHEGGHALFMQNEPEELYQNHADNHMSCAMHECISRFYENILGRSRGMIHFLYPKFRELSGEVFPDVSEEELYRAVNIARPSLVRTEADELTYSLHILIRYELERDMISGALAPRDLPAAFNRKVKEYLGLDVPSDDLGCLQDVHWTGMFGYFPSYALGSAYGAQILHTMEKDFDVQAALAAGELSRVLDWLRERVFAKASLLTPDQWIRDITGEGLNPDYYLDYLEQKYKELYDLA